jgi:tape measure domain-containing protein
MATTISSYKVSLALDANQYISASDLSRKETARLVREINGARSPADNYTRSLNLIDKALKQGAISQTTYNTLLDASKSKLAGASSAVKGLGSSLAGMAASYVGFSTITGLIKDSVLLAAEAESASIAFEVLTGSVQESAQMVEGLRQLAATTPLSLRDTQGAAKTMLAFGIAADSVLPSLKMLGDITGGNSERFKNLTLGFSQMAAAGRLMGGELRQMVEAGFNPLQEISRKTGESMLELKKRMEDGGIATQEVMQAFKSATSEGGMFFGMIDRMAETTQGKLAKLTDEIYGFKKALGDTLIGIPEIGKSLSLVMKNLSLLRQGMEVVAGGGAANIKGDYQAEMERLKQQRFFADRQIRRRREGLPTVGQLSDQTLRNMQGPAMDTSSGIESAIQSTVASVGSMASTVLTGLSTFQDAAEMISMAGVAQTQELVTSMKESPAVKNLQVGTQEAYAALTQATSEAERSSRLEAKRQQQLAENAAAQREKLLVYMERMNQALENNGFKRIR